MHAISLPISFLLSFFIMSVIDVDVESYKLISARCPFLKSISLHNCGQLEGEVCRGTQAQCHTCLHFQYFCHISLTHLLIVFHFSLLNPISSLFSLSFLLSPFSPFFSQKITQSTIYCLFYLHHFRLCLWIRPSCRLAACAESWSMFILTAVFVCWMQTLPLSSHVSRGCAILPSRTRWNWVPLRPMPLPNWKTVSFPQITA